MKHYQKENSIILGKSHAILCKAQNKEHSLTLQEKESLEFILSLYDASSLSEDDIHTIVDAFKDAGIKPSQTLYKAIEDLGFSPKEIIYLLEVHEQRNIPTNIDELFDFGKEEEYKAVFSYERFLEYTYKIISLNDETKKSFKKLIEEYSLENTNLSIIDAKRVIENYIGLMLKKSVL